MGITHSRVAKYRAQARFFYADLYSVFSHRRGDRLHNLNLKVVN